MYEAWLHDRYVSWSWWGRFALAIVSTRARTCPRRTCGRSRRCLGRYGGPNASLHATTWDCPIMSATEWRCVSFGIRGNCTLLGPWQLAQREKEHDEEKKMPREEQLRRRAERDQEAARRREEGEPWRDYALMLWARIVRDRPCMPADVAATGERLIAWRAARGCHCAKAGRLECEEEEECFRRVSGETAVGSRE